MTKGLFERWLEIERASGRPLSEALDELNQQCGTKYKHNWPSVMMGRAYSLDRLPTAVRQYMMSRVLPGELKARGLTLKPAEIFKLVVNLT